MSQASLILTVDAVPLRERNVVVVGRYGSGKSSVANKIIENDIDGASFQVSSSGLSNTTTKPSTNSVILKTANDQHYLVQVVDSVGLFENKSKKTNDTLVSEMKSLCKQSIPKGIHLILFVFDQKYWREDEERAIHAFVGQFGGSQVSEISALILTGCDGYTQEKKDEIQEEFTRLHRDVAAFMKKGIYPVSFQDITKLRPEIRDAHQTYQKADQEALRQLVYQCDDETKLLDEILQDSFWNNIRTSLCNIM